MRTPSWSSSPVTLGTDEAHGEQDEIGLELELRSGDRPRTRILSPFFNGRRGQDRQTGIHALDRLPYGRHHGGVVRGLERRRGRYSSRNTVRG
jgi:hypothetical protein